MARISKKQKTKDAIIAMEKERVQWNGMEIISIENLIQSPTRYFYDVTVKQLDGVIVKSSQWQFVKIINEKIKSC